MSSNGQPPERSDDSPQVEPPTLTVVGAESGRDESSTDRHSYQLAARVSELEARNRQLAGWLWEAERKLSRLPEYERAWREWDELDREIALMRRSRSWRYTAGVRRVGRLCRRLLPFRVPGDHS